MPRFLYLRGLRQVDHAVFGVVDGQKFYRSPTNGRKQPFSSGQQVKRSILDALVERIEGEQRAPITFNYQVSKNKKGEPSVDQKEPWNPCDPRYADQLMGGWMRAEKGSTPLRRRSPLSISAMRPLHHSLAGLEENENGTFDRSDKPDQHVLKVRDEKGNDMSQEQITAFLTENERSLPMRNWLQLGPRANGLFVFDVAIDLDRLFSVSTNQYDPELTVERIEELKAAGWTDTGKELVAPAARQNEIIDALAEALVDWRITSNQSRTFSPQGTLAIAMSNNANSIVNAIRADLLDDQPEGRDNAEAVIDDTINGVTLFVAPVAKGFVKEIAVDGNAMNNAKKAIKEQLSAAVAAA